MDFESCKEVIRNLLAQKAANNKQHEASIKLSEIVLSIRATTDLTHQLYNWLLNSGMVTSAVIDGKGLIRCIVKEEIWRNNK